MHFPHLEMTGPSGNPLQIQLSSAAGLRKFASGGYLYGLLDAYDNPAVPQKVQELGQEFAVSLFVGAAEKKCWDLAPYLIAVQEATLDWMMQTIWNAPCGVFILVRTRDSAHTLSQISDCATAGRRTLVFSLLRPEDSDDIPFELPRRRTGSLFWPGSGIWGS
jgi:hypothetical protein